MGSKPRMKATFLRSLLFQRTRRVYVEGVAHISPVNGVQMMSGDHKGVYLQDLLEDLNHGKIGKGILRVDIEWEPLEE